MRDYKRNKINEEDSKNTKTAVSFGNTMVLSFFYLIACDLITFKCLLM